MSPTFAIHTYVSGNHWILSPTLTIHTCRYAMREALAIVGEEGLEPMWARHKELHLQV